MLEAALDPFDRPSGFARGQSQQHDVGEHRVLGAETATRMRWRAQPQPIARDTQSHCHDRVHGKWTLEIGDDLVGLFAGQILGDHNEAFDRCGGIAGIAGRDRDPMLGFGKGGVRIAVAKSPFADHIRADRRMEQRRIRLGRRLGIHDRRQRPVFDHNLLKRVLGGMTVARQHHRNRLADVTHPVHREAPLLHCRLDRDGERSAPAAGILAGDDAIDARQSQRAGDVHRQDLGMGVRRAQDRSVQRIGANRQIVAKAPVAPQQIGVFEAANGAPGIGGLVRHAVPVHRVARRHRQPRRHLPRNCGRRFW